MSIRDILKLALILALIVGAVAVFNRVETVQSREETTIVRDAVRQAAVTCYAVEGAYPDSVEYLRDHYVLPDHRTSDDSEQASGAVTDDDPSWDAAYALWRSEYEAAIPVIDQRIETGDFFVFE